MKFYRGKTTKAGNNIQRSIGAAQGGYLVANTNYMAQRWNRQATFHNSDINPAYHDYNMSALQDASRGTNQLIASVDKLLDQIIKSQQIGLRRWLNQLQRRGIIATDFSPNGQKIKRIYDIVSRLGIIGNQINLSSIRQSTTSQQLKEKLTKMVDLAIEKYNPYTYVRKALLKLMQQDGVRAITASQEVIQKVLDDVKNQITALIFKQFTKSASKMQKDDYDWSSALQNQIQNKYDQLYGPRLKQVLRKAQNQQYKLNSANSLITSYKGNNESAVSLRMLFHSNNNQGEFQRWLGAELISAIGGKGLGADQVYHTGQDLTRIGGSHYLGNVECQFKSNIKEISPDDNAKMVKNKDDALWVYNLKDGNNKIAIHISSKLYGRRGQTNEKATEGIGQIELQKGGRLDLRSRQLQYLIKRQTKNGSDSNYQKLMFGLVNLSKDSLIQHGDNVKSQYQSVLAAMFAAFMFNATRQQITGWLPSQYKKAQNNTHDIYIFDVDGMYITLAEMAQQIKNNFHTTMKDVAGKDISRMIHVTITPSDYDAIANKQSGAMNVSAGAVDPQKSGPFSQNDWMYIRNKIINTTKIGVVTADMNSFFDSISNIQNTI